ncbi:MAG: molybdopterin-guanine dinucleotide biosynthesis protein MobB [Gammaproteobacteria bacterium]|nr:molybdopterin-guanine dinucleotide biosynthesis protein MobB [Gammaproteobacteria bacterium]MDH3406827.1 molybdopterin-guanine dinucleotide biosynthesis protein MobB [Gammaproteobacteria bacterium]MDH3562332.1 molybdopterin-guanine dinucleotide biosynthesis protein MobB [Gammaproteobacteria bacterium]MDH5486650.1 molybdopterin-guanine dinucleotide biosynthesis protein MobB [Gammaproteobacteria bacterium]
MKLNNAHLPILGFAAFSGTGKTTLLVKLLTVLRARGYRIGVVKHAHHSFEIDKPGKDSFELRKAGATQTLVASRERWALVTEEAREQEPRLSGLLRHLDQQTLDFILVEGFKAERFPKIELYRPRLGHPLLHPDDDSIIAIATDSPLPVNTSLPLLDLNQPESIANFIVEFLFGSDQANNCASHSQ